MQTNNNNFLNSLEVFANILQLGNFSMLLEDANNNDLLKYLQHQDNDLLAKIIEQNEVIIEQNKKLLKLMKGGINEN